MTTLQAKLSSEDRVLPPDPETIEEPDSQRDGTEIEASEGGPSSDVSCGEGG